MMKLKHFLFLSAALICLIACNNDDDLSTGYSVLWSPVLSESLIADGSVTLRWKGYNEYVPYTKCVMPDYTVPTHFEIYQSDQPDNGFIRIAEMKNNNTNMSFQVNNLPNGKPVYFRIKSSRKGYETRESKTYMFIPNAQFPMQVTFQIEQDGHLYTEMTPSPDGQKVATINQVANQSLYLYNLDGSGKQQLAENVYKPAWANDHLLTFITDHYAAEAKLKVFDCHTGETATLKSFTRHWYDYTLSPDGSKLLYTVNENTEMKLYVYQVETGKDSLVMSRALNGKGLEYTEPIWIDNDSYLVKKSQAYAPYTVTLSLITYADHKVEDLIANYSYAYYFASLSPDKKHIAYIDYQNESPFLMLFNTQNGTLRQLSGYEADKWVYYLARYSYWKDNQTLYYTDYSYANGALRILSVIIP